MKIILQHYEKGLFVLMAMVAVWSIYRFGPAQVMSQMASSRSLTGAVYAPANPQLVETEPADWPQPPVQSHGPDWRFDVFTPPDIYYDAVAGSFRGSPPAEPVAVESVAGLRLIEVRRELYRLQLTGYIGGPDDYIATFVSPGMAGTLLARPGHRFENLGLTLKDFAVRKVAQSHAGDWPVYDVMAQAVLFDERSGAEVVLNNRTLFYTDQLQAVLQLQPEDRPALVLETGRTFTDHAIDYRIARILSDPPEVVVVSRNTDGSEVATIRLHPGGARPESSTAGPVAIGNDSNL